jgi:metal-sulfur cluster biosynthetic enzyme
MPTRLVWIQPRVSKKVKLEGSTQVAFWNQLKLVFDLEIPVNVADLKLI